MEFQNPRMKGHCQCAASNLPGGHEHHPPVMVSKPSPLKDFDSVEFALKTPHTKESGSSATSPLDGHLKRILTPPGGVRPNIRLAASPRQTRDVARRRDLDAGKG
jgi:hypothetical protein